MEGGGDDGLLAPVAHDTHVAGLLRVRLSGGGGLFAKAAWRLRYWVLDGAAETLTRYATAADAASETGRKVYSLPDVHFILPTAHAAGGPTAPFGVRFYNGAVLELGCDDEEGRDAWLASFDAVCPGALAQPGQLPSQAPWGALQLTVENCAVRGDVEVLSTAPPPAAPLGSIVASTRGLLGGKPPKPKPVWNKVHMAIVSRVVAAVAAGRGAQCACVRAHPVAPPRARSAPTT